MEDGGFQKSCLTIFQKKNQKSEKIEMTTLIVTQYEITI